MRSPEFQALIAPARQYPQIWRVLLGILLIIFIYIATTALIFWAGFAYATPFKFLTWANAVSRAETPVPTLIVLFTFSGMALGAILAAPALHYRSPGSLFGPLGETLRGFVIAAASVLIIAAIAFVASLFFDPPVAHLPFSEWLKYLPLALPLLLIQTSAEELVFRGYLQQQLAARFKSRFIWMVIPSLLFASLHYSAELGTNLWLVLGVTFIFALISADLVEKTGSLGASIGLHFANNIFALLVISIDGPLSGLSLYKSSYGLADTTILPYVLIANILVLLVIWRILRFLLAR